MLSSRDANWAREFAGSRENSVDVRGGATRKRHGFHWSCSGGASDFETGSGIREGYFATFGRSHGHIQSLASSGRITWRMNTTYSHSQ